MLAKICENIRYMIPVLLIVERVGFGGRKGKIDAKKLVGAKMFYGGLRPTFVLLLVDYFPHWPH